MHTRQTADTGKAAGMPGRIYSFFFFIHSCILSFSAFTTE
ncbi:hypothetical protein AC141_30300 [Bacteroides fragilis]|nr:hypothetical protein AC141_30300 [Bacteroides fragilis]